MVDVRNYDSTKTFVSEYYRDKSKLQVFLYSNIDKKVLKNAPNGEKIYVELTSADNEK
jgi:hypothetical protein